MAENFLQENYIKEQKELTELEDNKYLSQIFKKKHNILQKKKEELNHSILFNKNYNSNSLHNISEKENLNDINDDEKVNKELILPRIPSADSGKKNINADNINTIKKKRNISSKGKKYLPPKPNKLNNNRTMMYNNEFIKLKKENEYMITELERLNIELRSLIDKQIPFINIKNKYDTEEKRLDINKENEKKANKKYLHTLITEYNRIYKNLTIGQDRNVINKLEKKLNFLRKSYKDDKKANKILKDQIYKNEQDIENFSKKRQNQINNLNDSENKYILYKNKIKELDDENERMNKLLIDEEGKNEQLKINYSKYEEILNYYEETNENLKHTEEKKNKELEIKLNKLIKKREILNHARLSMEKSYANKIDKQKKNIIELNNTLNELNKAIKTLSD